MRSLPAVLLLLLLPAATFAQTPPAARPEAENLADLLASRPVVDRPLTIDEAVSIALKESPIIRGAIAEAEAAEGRMGVSRAQMRPYLSANTFASGGSNGNAIASPTLVPPQMIMLLPRGAFVDQNLTLMVPLYTGGRLTALVRQAASLHSASAADREMQRQEVALLTRTAYREVIARRALVGVQQARVTDDAEQLRLDRIRLEQQQIPAYYVSRDEAEAASAQQDLTNAQRDVDLALVQLQTVMGVNPASHLDVAEEPAYQPSGELIARLAAGAPSAPVADKTGAAALSGDLAALLRLAERQRPELIASRQRVRGAAQSVEAARGTYRPQVSLFAMGDARTASGENGFAGTTVGVTAAMPLYDGGQRQADVHTADAERRREEQEQQRIALQVAQEVQDALLNLRAAERNVQTAKTALTSAQEEYRVADLRYQSGRSVVTEALDASAARVQAESSVVQAVFQYNVAQDQLLRAVGETPG